MATLDRWDPFRGPFPDTQFSRLFNDFFGRVSQEQNLTTWAPAVDIFEGQHELVVKADYKDGVLTLSIPKREEAKPKQIKVNVGGQAAAAAAR